MTDLVVFDVTLMHYGVPGMRWGVRKLDSSSLIVKSQGVRIGSDGSIDIQKGASLQRLVRSSGASLPMKDLTYASLSDYDNARYIKTIGGKGIFGGGRDQILSIQATQNIKAPSLDESTKMVSDLFLNDAKFQKTYTNMMDVPISKKELDRIRSDPGGKTARAWYESVNQSLTFDAEFDPIAPYVQKTVREKVQSKGYNALRDENDVAAKISKAPIIIFSPDKSLKVITVTTITDEIRQANKEKLKQYKSLGKNWAEEKLYD